jgi:hypothetical protein
MPYRTRFIRLEGRSAAEESIILDATVLDPYRAARRWSRRMLGAAGGRKSLTGLWTLAKIEATKGVEPSACKGTKDLLDVFGQS